MKNIEYFKEATQYPEKVLDIYYLGVKDTNLLNNHDTELLFSSYEKLVDAIKAFDALKKISKISLEDELIDDILENVIAVLKVKGMNFSELSQFFMVHNISFSIYQNLSLKEKKEVLFHVLNEFIEKRHDYYLKYGYSKTTLQVMSDNYSHKRKGSIGIKKIIKQLKNYQDLKLCNHLNEFIKTDNHYIMKGFSPDKGDKNLFYEFIDHYKLNYDYSKIHQKKLPDFVLRLKEEFFIIEHKNLKENGGGQDKQVSEVIDFIRFEEVSPNFHYLSYIDGIYFNRLNENATAKNLAQYKDILRVLEDNKKNFFVNTYAFEKIVSDFLG